ncbi:MAG TPA: DUF5818 domain-containing protein [Terracidiphilus sp.]|nr:DUF5818 domain-containing protein [Terracidiphilus sp.]
MKSDIKRCLFVSFSLILAALTVRRFGQELEIAGGVGKPDSKPGPDAAPSIEPDKSVSPVLTGTAPRPFSATTVTFNGTVMRKGSRFVLRETAGEFYPLESAGRAWCYEGEDVRVTGKIDLSTRLLHVDAIELVA